MRTVAGLVSLLAAAEEEPVLFSNERPRPAAPGAGSKLEKEALLSRPHWVLCSPTWTPGSLLPGTQLLFLPTPTPRSTLPPREYAENSNLITPLLQWLPSYLAMGGRPVPALGPTTPSCVRPGHTGHEGLRRAMFSESVSAASGTFHPIPTPSPLTRPPLKSSFRRPPPAPDTRFACRAAISIAPCSPPRCDLWRVAACSPGTQVKETAGFAPVVPACL